MRFLKLVILILLLPLATHAAGLAVEPAKIDVELATGEEKKVILQVENISQSVSLYDVWVDDAANIIKVSPASFTLESGEKKGIAVTVASPNELQLVTNISLLGRSLGAQEFSLTPGIKIPVSLKVIKTNKSTVNEYLLYTVLGLMVLTVVVWMIIFTHLSFKKKRSWRVFKLK